MKSLSLFGAGLLFIILQAGPVIAQSSDVLTSEGISGDVDKDRRTPSLSVRPVVGTKVVQLLVDAFEPNSNFTKYPMRFDFFVNRKLYSSQIRSPELPGPVGVEIPNDFAPLPFNYSVVATLLHPNKTYTTMINGAVFSSTLSATLDCTLSVGDEEFLANDVAITQVTNSTFSVNFTGNDALSETDATLSTTVTVSGTTASATLSVTKDGETTTTATTGTITSTDGKLTSVELASSNDVTSLSCS